MAQGLSQGFYVPTDMRLSVEDPEAVSAWAIRNEAWTRGELQRIADLFLQFTSARYVAAERLAARGLDARFVELTLGLALTLEDESAIPRWAQGDHTAFESVSVPYHEGPGGSTARRAGRRLPLFPDGGHR